MTQASFCGPDSLGQYCIIELFLNLVLFLVQQDRVLEGVGRTNNNIEAWHNAFQNDCKKHTNLSKFIKTVKLEQSNTESLIAKIESGIIFKKDKKEEERDNILMNHILNFKKEDL